MCKELYEVGELPKLGELPKYMHAWTIRTERLGQPLTAFRQEIVETPKAKKGEMIIANRMAGVNYNGIWAALGTPKNVIDANGDYDAPEDFHICGSETSGIVYAVGEGVTEFKVGDEVCAGGAQYDEECERIKAGEDPCFSPTYRIWGYEANWGGFAQFSRVKPCQCVKKPSFLNWAEAAACTATGVTVYRMLNRWKGNEIQKGDVVLVWGGYGGIGTSAIPLIRHFGAIPIAVVSSQEKGEKCIELGAAGFINRTKYDHWGDINNLDEKRYRHWVAQAGKFKKEIFRIVGEKKAPRIVIEHPGADTLPTSLFVCDSGGMVVLCGATSSYKATIDLRFLWLNQKRIQGCHAGTKEDYKGYIKAVEESEIHPLIGKIYRWDELAQAHQDLYEGKTNGGKIVINIAGGETNG